MPVNRAITLLDRLAKMKSASIQEKPDWVIAGSQTHSRERKPGLYEVDASTKDKAEIDWLRMELDKANTRLDMMGKQPAATHAPRQQPQQRYQVSSMREEELCSIFGVNERGSKPSYCQEIVPDTIVSYGGAEEDYTYSWAQPQQLAQVSWVAKEQNRNAPYPAQQNQG